MIYRFRVLLDTDEDVYRDIEIEENATAEDLHNAIIQAFGFDGTEMASFYLSNEMWDQGEEIVLFDIEETGEIKTMGETILEDIVNENKTKLIYVYDFLSLWTFMVELAEITEADFGVTYPNLMYSHGQIPAEAPEKEFIGEEIGDEDDMYEEDYDLDPEDYENLDFDENWN